MKQTNKKKGFTIVELVIVIAVIGILSAVLIPTFSGLVNKANETAKQEGLRNAYTTYASQYEYEAGKELYSQEEVYFVVYSDSAAADITTLGSGNSAVTVYHFVNGEYIKLETLDSTKKLTKVADTNFNGYNAYKLVANA